MFCEVREVEGGEDSAIEPGETSLFERGEGGGRDAVLGAGEEAGEVDGEGVVGEEEDGERLARGAVEMGCKSGGPTECEGDQRLGLECDRAERGDRCTV